MFPLLFESLLFRFSDAKLLFILSIKDFLGSSLSAVESDSVFSLEAGDEVNSFVDFS